MAARKIDVKTKQHLPLSKDTASAALVVVPPAGTAPAVVQTIKADLHGVRDKLAMLCEGLLDAGVPVLDKEGRAVLVDGRPIMCTPDAATLSVIRQFLRDNGITADALPAAGKPITDGLPFGDEESAGCGKNDTPPGDDDEPVAD